MNNTIQSLWIGSELSAIEHLCITSFLYHGQEYHLYVYDDVKNLPPGVILKDANEILPRSQIFTYAKIGGYGGFADWFRYCLLYKYGGYWVDTDVVCLKPFDFSNEIVFGQVGPSYMGNGVLRFPVQSPILKQLITLCEKPNQFMPWDNLVMKFGKVRRILMGNRPNNILHAETGPHAITNLLTHHGLIDNAKPFYYFYPTAGVQWQAAFDGTLPYTLEFFANSYTIHLWNEMMRQAEFDKNGTFPPNSLFELLKRRYLRCT